tara:strand:- start:127 stop:303 length:177 start_codon:yes stop_codon:yes gene_type:complete
MQIDVAHKQQHNNPTIQQHNNTTTRTKQQEQNNKELNKITKNKKCCTFKKLHNLTQTT